MGHEIAVQMVEREGGPQYTMTIPRPIAQAMGFKKGDILDLSIEQGNIVLRPMPTKETLRLRRANGIFRNHRARRPE